MALWYGSAWDLNLPVSQHTHNNFILYLHTIVIHLRLWCNLIFTDHFMSEELIDFSKASSGDKKELNKLLLLLLYMAFITDKDIRAALSSSLDHQLQLKVCTIYFLLRLSNLLWIFIVSFFMVFRNDALCLICRNEWGEVRMSKAAITRSGFLRPTWPPTWKKY